MIKLCSITEECIEHIHIVETWRQLYISVNCQIIISVVHEYNNLKNMVVKNYNVWLNGQSWQENSTGEALKVCKKNK